MAELQITSAQQRKSILPQHFSSVQEVKEAIGSLTLLRREQEGCDPRHTVIACHAGDLEEALAYYRGLLDIVPEFYVLHTEAKKATVPHYSGNIHDFGELHPDMDVQLYFHPEKTPIQTAYPQLAAAMRRQGFIEYSLERFSAEKFYGRRKKYQFSDADWDVVLNFANSLHDEKSCHTYLAACRARLDADPGFIPIADYPQYFHPEVSVKPGDIVCEGGCYTDQFVDSATYLFHQSMQNDGRIICFEPMADTFHKLKELFAAFPNICLEQKALWSRTGHVSLSGNGASAGVGHQTLESVDYPCTSIDDYFSRGQLPSVIKLDVEGAEPHVLDGARHTLKNALPKLMLAIYHGRCGTDWITVPRLLLEYGLPYNYFCGHHQPWYAETCLYAQKKL